MPTPPDSGPDRDGADRLPDEPDDVALLARHLAGDATAFDDLVRRHRDRAWAVALRTLGNPDDAADAVQEAFISAFRAAGSFRAEAMFSTWLHRIVVNACLDRVRRAQSRPTAPLDTAAAAVADPHDRVDQHETRLDVEAALRRLPVDQRVAITLVDLQGLSVIEAAEIAGVPVGTVKSRCHRGRAQLAVLLGHLRPGRPAGARTQGTDTARSASKPDMDQPSDQVSST